jgi:hypothetical protein
MASPQLTVTGSSQKACWFLVTVWETTTDPLLYILNVPGGWIVPRLVVMYMVLVQPVLSSVTFQVVPLVTLVGPNALLQLSVAADTKLLLVGANSTVTSQVLFLGLNEVNSTNEKITMSEAMNARVIDVGFIIAKFDDY